MSNYLTAQQIYEKLIKDNIYEHKGSITMSLAGIDVIIKSTDTVGNNIQEWLNDWLYVNNVYHRTPDNSQNFPDFYLSESQNSNLLEVKSFYAPRRPAFDVANFDSYWKSLVTDPYRLDVDYLIFAYDLVDGQLSIRKVYLKKVWEITGKSTDYALNCQRKNGQIYNIRPVSFNSTRSNIIPPFNSKERFIAAIYRELLSHLNQAAVVKKWLSDVIEGYYNYSNQNIEDEVKQILKDY
ncbi:NgoBV family restriction endonuclease [Paenibacillus camelliae]|uniref:NgoBV family restriction endonuclease n=1 Tax=Paenibacillus camelliae TaxID=512410 RepID=UPI00203FBAB5|nr:NgoBV family restriction endonuclease [Paenibacillus camelliae]MCM3634263.1 NgoBV family restriction endonuclease [Paenibacillus camelliae]